MIIFTLKTLILFVSFIFLLNKIRFFSYFLYFSKIMSKKHFFITYINDKCYKNKLFLFFSLYPNKIKSNISFIIYIYLMIANNTLVFLPHLSKELYKTIFCTIYISFIKNNVLLDLSFSPGKYEYFRRIG